jgi:hypothetical protein
MDDEKIFQIASKFVWERPSTATFPKFPLFKINKNKPIEIAIVEGDNDKFEELIENAIENGDRTFNPSYFSRLLNISASYNQLEISDAIQYYAVEKFGDDWDNNSQEFVFMIWASKAGHHLQVKLILRNKYFWRSPNSKYVVPDIIALSDPCTFQVFIDRMPSDYLDEGDLYKAAKLIIQYKNFILLEYILKTNNNLLMFDQRRTWHILGIAIVSSTDSDIEAVQILIEKFNAHLSYTVENGFKNTYFPNSSLNTENLSIVQACVLNKHKLLYYLLDHGVLQSMPYTSIAILCKLSKAPISEGASNKATIIRMELITMLLDYVEQNRLFTEEDIKLGWRMPDDNNTLLVDYVTGTMNAKFDFMANLFKHRNIIAGLHGEFLLVPLSRAVAENKIDLVTFFLSYIDTDPQYHSYSWLYSWFQNEVSRFSRSVSPLILTTLYSQGLLRPNDLSNADYFIDDTLFYS